MCVARYYNEDMQTILNPQNRLFELARSAKRLPGTLAASVLAVLFVFVGQFIGAVPYVFLLLTGGLPSDTTPLGSALYLIAFFAITLTPTGLLLWIWIGAYEKRSPRTLGLEKDAALSKFLRGLLIGALLFLAVVLALYLPGYLTLEEGFSGISLAALAAVLIVLPAWILQGSLEEVVMRGWLMPVAGVRSKPWLGVLLSSLLFATLHLLNPNVTVLSVLNLALAGLLFALVALWEGGIWTACGLHAAWNWVQDSLGFAVSGNLLNGPSLLSLAENGPDLITGGAFGPEGGLANTAVNLIACVVFGWLIIRKNRRSEAVLET